MEQRGVVRAGQDVGADPRIEALAGAVHRMRRELDSYPAQLRDRLEAERELEALAAAAEAGAPAPAELRQSLLLLAAAVGSVSALASPLAAVRGAVELFGTAPRTTH